MSGADRAIVELSRFYGRNPEWIIAGGGNTSVKDAETLWVKASGTALGEATPESFVAIDRKRLAETWEREYPTEVDAREKAALEDLMNARRDGETLRPSVETGMHEAIPARYVVHTHPTVVNALTCGVDGAAAVTDIFGDEALWIPSINPGYVLSKRIHTEFAKLRAARRDGAPARRVGAETGTDADAGIPLVFLQNHGLTVASDDAEEIYTIHRRVLQRVLQRITRRPDMGLVESDLGTVAEVGTAIRRGFHSATGDDGVVLFEATAELLQRAESPKAMEPLMKPFSPDHIVYAGAHPLYIENGGSKPTDIGDRFVEATADEGAPPRVVVVRGVGAFTVGASRKVAETARMLFRDAVTIAAYAESFGGARPMDPDQVDFIRNWEVERFRAKVSLDG